MAPAGSAMQSDAEKERLLAVFGAGSYRTVIAENRAHFYGDIVDRRIGLFLSPMVFARFLFGLYVGRKGWASRTADLVPRLRRLLPWAAALGVVGNGVLLVNEGELDSYWTHLGAVVEEAGILALAFTYLATLVLLFHRGPQWRVRLGRLAPVGRMALTNYLTHSVLYLLLFSGVGLGLYGEVGPALCVVFSIVIFAAQIVISRWWLSRYRFGPAEWLWRTLTYGELQPMRAGVHWKAA
jgi:uncharacterized protein